MSLVALPARARPARRVALRTAGEKDARCACNLMRGPDAAQSRMLGHIAMWAPAGPVSVWHDAHPVRHGIRPDPVMHLKVLPPVALVEEVMA